MIWPCLPAERVLAVLERIGWRVKREPGPFRVLWREDWPDHVFPFRGEDEIGSRTLARIARHSGLRPSDL